MWFTIRIWRVVAAVIVAFVGSLLAAPQEARANASMSAAQLDQLVAPIALYPDPLVVQILIAATYPLEVAEADRWLRIPANAALKGDALTSALQRRPWDPSIKSLVAFPQVLHILNRNLEWTEQLGEAFLAQQDDVMDAIQRLRQRAQAAGTLASTPQQMVSTEDQEITIESPSPDIVYVPSYNPWCIYGSWPYPNYPPFYFGDWTGACLAADDVMGFGAGIYPFGFWAWGYPEWRRHHIRVNAERFRQFHDSHAHEGEIWQHDPAHRHGVTYRNPATAARFHAPAGAAPNVIRGFAPTPSIAAPERPAGSSGRIGHPTTTPVPAPPSHALPPAFESFGGGAQVRSESARGFSSRMSVPAPSFHAAPMPSFQAAPMSGFHGGFGGHR
jgi:hypothetical protein